MIRLSIKGPLKSAKRAATSRGIPVKNCVAFGPKKMDIGCDAPDGARTKVMYWFNERRSSLKQGRGYAPGELLFFNGARRKRRKRR